MKQQPRYSRLNRSAQVARAIATAIGIWLAGTQAVRAETASPDIAVGYSHACARRANGMVSCWGSNDSGQIGDGTTVDRSNPVAVASLGTGVVEIAAGDLFSCARKNDGTLWCWGSNTFGQLGDGTTFDSLVPIQVIALGGAVAEVSTGDTFACARKTDGTLWCWGAGYLGDGTSNGSFAPLAVTALGSAVAEVSTGDAATCARKTDGSLWCWGDNTFGAIGDGTTTTRPVPTQVTSLGNTVVGVSLGDLFGCARKADGTLWCWGNNDQGELGDGTTTNHLVPTQVSALGTTVTGVSANGRHACARMISGALQCWGWNVLGEIGDSSLVDRHLPVTVAGFGTPIAEVSAGLNHETCARTVAGSISCAGNNASGQVGDGTTTNRSAPVTIITEGATVPAVDHRFLALLAALLIALAIGTIRRRAATVASAVFAMFVWLVLSLAACDGANMPAANDPPPPEEIGSVSFDLTLGSSVHIDNVNYNITGPDGFMKAGSLDVSHSATVSGTVGGLPPGAGYALALSASDVAHKLTGCQGAATFSVGAGVATSVTVHMNCFAAPTTTPPAVPLSPVAMLALALLLAATGCAALRRRRR
jgi:alpha-tubulin suppressor-like RCC1 family protein